MNNTPDNTDWQIQIYKPNPYLIHWCPICLENPTNRTTGCGHHFCGGCIDSWMAEHNTCPLCRTRINSNLEKERNQQEDTTTELGNPEARIRMFAANFNVLRILSGMGGLTYSN